MKTVWAENLYNKSGVVNYNCSKNGNIWKLDCSSWAK
jgi:hypothetical protein